MKGLAPAVPGFRSEEEQAARCGITVVTLRRWRARGYGPRAVKIGRAILYAENADTQFLVEQAAAAENALEPRPRGRPRRSNSPLNLGERAPLAAAKPE
jgi:hypothetical protein